eukprot:jgi/Mesvir1/21308/Mv15930-RA.1
MSSFPNFVRLARVFLRQLPFKPASATLITGKGNGWRRRRFLAAAIPVGVCTFGFASGFAIAFMEGPQSDPRKAAIKRELMVEMTCGACARAVEESLYKVAGVESVEVDVGKNTVQVTGGAAIKDMLRAVEGTGRRVRLVASGSGTQAFDNGSAVSEFKGPALFGVVRFTQLAHDLAQVEATLDGLAPGRHALAIHTYGDLSNVGGGSTGGRFNPHGARHGGPGHPERCVGDLGNVEADAKGHAECTMWDDQIKVWDLIGRGMVVYEGEDDLKTPPDGNAGKLIAAAVIARSSGIGQNLKKVCLCDGTTLWESTSAL